MLFFARTAIRSTRSVAFTPRAFSTSLAIRKTATEVVKDTVKTVDRKVSDKLVGGIELGQTATQKAKSAVGIGSTEEAKAKASELAGKAKGKAHEAAGDAKGKARETAGDVEGAINELSGKW